MSSVGKIDLTKEEAGEIASKVDGFISSAEGELLYDLASECSGGSIVEIGSWKGRSTIWLAVGARRGRCPVVYSVDIHSGSKDHLEKQVASTLEVFRDNIRSAGLEDIVIPLVMSSEEAAKIVTGPVSLLFLDGPTESEDILKELERWLPLMSEGGIVALHDTLSTPGPRSVAEHLYLSSRFRDVRAKESLTYATVARDTVLSEKMRDLKRLIVKRVEIILGHISYPAPVRRLGRRVIDALAH